MATWGSWNTSSSISASTITNTSSATSEAIDNNNKKSTEIAIVATYDATTANEGLEVYVLRQEGSTAYQSISDKPFSAGRLDYATSATRKFVFTVPSQMVSNFKVALQNNSGASVTSVTLYYRQST